MKVIKMTAQRDFPKVVLIDTVSFCNLRCSMCSHKGMKRKKGRMEWPLFKKIIDEIAEINKNTRVWMVFFGEALILKKTKPSIFDMILYAKSAGIKEVVLNSNGNLLDKESSARLIDAGLDAIYIGLDAFSEETYNKLRVGGDYRQTVQNVLDLIEVKKAKKVDKFEIQVQFVELDENIKERDEFISFWISKGVNVKIRQKLSWGGLIGGTISDSNIKRHKCYWMMDTMSITNEGDVTICAADPEGRLLLGNLRNQSLKEVWNGKLKELRNLHEKEQWDKLPFPCNQCIDWMISYKDRLIIANKEGGLKRIKRYFSRLYLSW